MGAPLSPPLPGAIVTPSQWETLPGTKCDGLQQEKGQRGGRDSVGVGALVVAHLLAAGGAGLEYAVFVAQQGAPLESQLDAILERKDAAKVARPGMAVAEAVPPQMHLLLRLRHGL